MRETPAGSWLRVGDLTVEGVSAPQYTFPQFPVGNATDGNSATRWMAPNTPGTKIVFDMGELRMFSHLEIEWGTTYSDNYTVQVTEDGSTWFDVTTVTGGSGGLQTVDLSQNSKAFGKAIRLNMTGFEVTPGTGDWGVAIREIDVFRRVHDDCNETLAMSCTGAWPTHVCESSCGGYASGLNCYCDSACGNFGDCCSFDGANNGTEYVSGVADVCEFDY